MERSADRRLRARLTTGAGPLYVVMAGRMATNTGLFMVIPFLLVYLTVHEGMSGYQAGLLFAILQFTRRVLAVAAGWLSDRFGAERILSLGLLIESAAYGFFAVAGRSFAAWALAVALLGFGGAMNNNGSRAVIAAGRAAATTAVNLSRYYASINAAALVGPLIGSALLAGGQSRTAFLLTAGFHLAFGAVSAMLLRNLRAPRARTVRLREIALGARDRHLVAYCGLAVAGWFLISQYRIGLPLTIVHQGLPGAWLGPLTAVNAIVCMIAVSVIGSRVAKRGTVARLDVLGVSGLVLGGGWLLCAFGGVGPLIAAVMVTSVGESLFCGIVDALIVALAPEGYVALYLGYSAMAWGIGGMLAGFTGGLFTLLAQHGMLVVFWLGLAAIGAGTAAGTRLARGYFTTAIEQRRPAEESPAPTATQVSGGPGSVAPEDKPRT